MEGALALTAAVLVFSVILIGGYSVWDARERRGELGILLAVAAEPRHVAWLMILKMLVLGVAGGVLGCVGGNLLAAHMGADPVTKLHPAMAKYLLYVTDWQMYFLAAGIAVALAVVPGLIGTCIASNTDPADTLREL